MYGIYGIYIPHKGIATRYIQSNMEANKLPGPKKKKLEETRKYEQSKCLFLLSLS